MQDSKSPTLTELLISFDRGDGEQDGEVEEVFGSVEERPPPSGPFAPKQVALLLRNEWPLCSGTGGPFAPKYAIKVNETKYPVEKAKGTAKKYTELA